jgi:hypothetical protein
MQRLGPAHTRQLDVHEDEGRPLFRGHAQAVLRVFCLDDAVAGRSEDVADKHPIVVVVLDDKDQLTRHEGSREA